ncbi:MAG: hypothetical protein ABI472_24900 [Ginsengibacter sp.]
MKPHVFANNIGHHFKTLRAGERFGYRLALPHHGARMMLSNDARFYCAVAH